MTMASRCRDIFCVQVLCQWSDDDEFAGKAISLFFGRMTVAVGTLITKRPPHRSVHARLRIRLLPRMHNGKASHGIGMQNVGWPNPTAEERIEPVPSYLSALAAADKYGAPQPADATAKD